MKHKKSAAVAPARWPWGWAPRPSRTPAPSSPSARRVSSRAMLIQVPIHVPVNVCGDTVNVVVLLNPAFGDGCANG